MKNMEKLDALQSERRFYEAAAALSPRIAAVLRGVPAKAAADAQEIRLRVGQPLALYTGGAHLFVDPAGVCRGAPSGAVLVSRADLFECFRTLCGYSVHTHQHEIEKGYISLPGGHRAGICGTLAGEGDRAAGLRDISAINLRVARQVRGVADPVARELFSNGLCGVLVAGAPSSGKTTLIRDLGRVLSDGDLGTYYKVAMVDERGELAAAYQGAPANDIGLCTDLLSGYPKRLGMEIAVRTLSPQVIVCDEIGRQDEVDAVCMSLFAAVQVITTVHCAGVDELKKRPQARRLLETGAFQKVVLLAGSEAPGTVREICDAQRCL